MTVRFIAFSFFDISPIHAAWRSRKRARAGGSRHSCARASQARGNPRERSSRQAAMSIATDKQQQQPPPPKGGACPVPDAGRPRHMRHRILARGKNLRSRSHGAPVERATSRVRTRKRTRVASDISIKPSDRRISRFWPHLAPPTVALPPDPDALTVTFSFSPSQAEECSRTRPCRFCARNAASCRPEK